LAGFALAPEDAGAHAAFERSDPAPNAILAESPSEIRIWFTEPLEFEQSRAVLYDQTGHPVPTNPSEPGEGEFSLLIRLDSPLERGTYSVAWNNLSTADGHPQQGYFAFTVGSQADVTAVVAPEVSDSEPPLWLQSASRWIVLLAISPLIAAWLMWLVVLYPTARHRAELVRTLAGRIKPLLVAAFVLAIAGNLLALFVQAAILSGGSLISRIGDLLADTRYGQLWVARIALILALGIALRLVDWQHPDRTRLTAAIALGLSLVLPLPISMNAHAAALGEGRTTAILFDWTHIVAAGAWFGGLIVLAGVLLRPFDAQAAKGRWGVLAAALPRFSAVALVCWGLLIMTGVYAAWLHVGSWDALRTTDYGKSLMMKLALIGLVLVFAALNLLLVTRRLAADPGGEGSARWRRRLGAAVSAEILIAVVLLFMVGRMTSLQPARDALAAESTGSSIAFDLEEQTATLQLTPGGAGPNHYQLTVTGDELPEDTEALLRLEFLGENLGIEELPLERPRGNLFEAHGSELSITGNWQVELIVRQIGGFNWTDTAELEISTGAAAARSLPWRFTSHSIAALLLVAIGLMGLAIAWRAGKSRLRTESGALAVLAIILGFGIMATDRVEPATAGIDYSLENPVPATADSIVTGKAIYENLCLSCHGVEGRGDGIAGAALIPPPADFTAGHAQVHADGEWFAWIRDGKPETGMPAFADSLSDEEIWHVINYVQTEFQGQAVEGSGTPSASPSVDEEEHEHE
jgi:copper transport protein